MHGPFVSVTIVAGSNTNTFTTLRTVEEMMKTISGLDGAGVKANGKLAMHHVRVLCQRLDRMPLFVLLHDLDRHRKIIMRRDPGSKIRQGIFVMIRLIADVFCVWGRKQR